MGVTREQAAALVPIYRDFCAKEAQLLSESALSVQTLREIQQVCDVVGGGGHARSGGGQGAAGEGWWEVPLLHVRCLATHLAAARIPPGCRC